MYDSEVIDPLWVAHQKAAVVANHREAAVAEHRLEAGVERQTVAEEHTSVSSVVRSVDLTKIHIVPHMCYKQRTASALDGVPFVVVGAAF